MDLDCPGSGLGQVWDLVNAVINLCCLNILGLVSFSRRLCCMQLLV
jgi:hypothetical protein